MAEVNFVSEGYKRVTPYLHVDGAEAAIDFYTKVFGAKERMRMPGPGGKLAHAELMFDDAVIMLADEFPDMGVLGPKAIGGTPVMLNLYVEDVDVTFAAALEAGATELNPVELQFYGDRAGQLVDPFGHHWSLATHVEDVPPDEMRKRMEEMMEAP
jgi:PhnB protein